MRPPGSFAPTEIRPGVVVPIRPCHSKLVGVLRMDTAHRLVAVEPITAGTQLFRIDGDKTHQPSRYSVQIAEGQHLDLAGNYGSEEIFDRYFWRFLNHSCEPNTLIRDQMVIATHDIARWADVTFDYNTTEFDIAEPFACHCASTNCLKIVKGFKHLTSAQRERLRPLLAPHLARLLDRRAERV